MPNPRLPIRIGYWIVAILFLSCHALTAAESPRALPADWWKSMTPEEIWKQSESATMGLNFYRGFKPQLKTDSNRSLEFLQRKRTDDSLELKWIRHSLKDSSWFAWCKTKEGRWFQADGGVAARMDMPDTEDDEIQYAKSMAEPYRYKVLEHTMIGAHDCVVISRTLSPPMFQVMFDAFKNSLKPEEIRYMLLNGNSPEDKIDYEKQRYIRKADSVSMGFLMRNRSGALLDDQLYDNITVNVPISDEKYGLQQLAAAPAYKTAEEFKYAIFDQDIKLKNGRLTKVTNNKYSNVIAILIASSLLFVFYRFRRKQSVY